MQRRPRLLAAVLAPGCERELILAAGPEMPRLKREPGGQRETSNRGTWWDLILECRSDRSACHGPAPRELIAQVRATRDGGFLQVRQHNIVVIEGERRFELRSDVPGPGNVGVQSAKIVRA